MNSNESIKAALHKIVNTTDVTKVRFIECYVSYVYNKDQEEYGTIDVISIENKVEIKGVSLSAIETNTRGSFNLPVLLSEVTIAQVSDSKYYVISYSHLDIKKIDVNKKLEFGVTEQKTPTEDQDYDEVEPTGKKTYTNLDIDYINTGVVDVNDSIDKSNTSLRNVDKYKSVVEDNKTSKSSTIEQTTESIQNKVGDVNLYLSETLAKIKSPQIEIGNGGATQKAVLGQTLSVVLKALIDQIGAITTTTAIGPQPILNAPTVIALKSQVDTILSTTLKIE